MTARPARRILRWTAGVLGGLLVVAVAGLVIWSQTGVYAAEEGAAAAVRANAEIAVSEDSGSLTLAPVDAGSGAGLVFTPGAKVEAWAYAAKLQELVAEEGMTVVITKPWLNLAFFDPRPLDAFTAGIDGVDSWLVGGHSLGGVRACQLAENADGLVLFASYCAADLSTRDLPVLSIAGSADGLSTPEKIAEARGQLPADAVLVEIPGAAHSSFGDYGPQKGDGVPDINDAAMTTEITELISDFVSP
ncbi:alpha/beta hydrolase [Zhihengliuella halotolerans]|uniref:Alpha/beta hydrolase family protein n=1 Tax=Zhihengliuella halotolerans TaxID=370736 RepID=A0A4Q8AEV7_9MICC|nr:alpha/beta hydrolase [Zhihengliuella halotolerans]RZU62822.1 alpha/beta hydrolase family protein [Zhihengliuella halotolerans]